MEPGKNTRKQTKKRRKDIDGDEEYDGWVLVKGLRLQPPGAEESNYCSIAHVVALVLTQHLVMIIVQAAFVKWQGGLPSYREMEPTWFKAVRFMIAVLYMDTHNYWLHRLMHENRWMYENIHSWHHRLHCPLPFGALYNHPLEGLLMDTLGGAIALEISGMDGPLQVLWVNVSYLKTVLDHCNIPISIPFMASTAFHDFHHRPQGFRFNYQQPYFTFWDELCGTAWDGSATAIRAKDIVDRQDKRRWMALLERRRREQSKDEQNVRNGGAQIQPGGQSHQLHVQKQLYRESRGGGRKTSTPTRRFSMSPSAASGCSLSPPRRSRPVGTHFSLPASPIGLTTTNAVHSTVLNGKKGGGSSINGSGDGRGGPHGTGGVRDRHLFASKLMGRTHATHLNRMVLAVKNRFGSLPDDDAVN